MFYELANNSWGPEELTAIERVIRSGKYTMGEEVEKYERAFEQKFSVKHAVMVSSGSSANLVAVAALCYKSSHPLRRGDEVIVPSISWATTYYPLQQYGLRLRFVDVELDTLNMDVEMLSKAISRRTRMVVAVSVLGNPCRLDQIREFCDRHHLILFEDNCESMGATLNSKPCGTFGDIGTFSTFFSHHISTMEGGVVITNDEELYQLVKCLRAHGWTRNLPSDSPLFEKKTDDFYEAYRFILPGYNVRPLEIEAAAGIEQLKKLEAMVKARQANASYFLKLFEKDDRYILQREYGQSSWFCFTIILNPKYEFDRKEVMRRLTDADIGFRIITGGNFLRHDVIRYFDYDRVGKIVNADIVHDRGFFVGNHPYDLTPQLDRLYEVLSKIEVTPSTRGERQVA